MNASIVAAAESVRVKKRLVHFHSGAAFRAWNYPVPTGERRAINQSVDGSVGRSIDRSVGRDLETQGSQFGKNEEKAKEKEEVEDP